MNRKIVLFISAFFSFIHTTQHLKSIAFRNKSNTIHANKKLLVKGYKYKVYLLHLCTVMLIFDKIPYMRFFILFISIIFLVFCACTKETHPYTNALVHETSPYLLQHAHNPINWQPWSEEILAKATKENKLILFSIGYASCHWCHVMEQETFENEEVAKFMNTHFINVKVDREEHPDIDKTYLKAVQMMTGNAGWPLHCITLPNGEPVWGGTYFTKEQWMNALEQIVKIHDSNPNETAQFAKKVANDIQKWNTFSSDTLLNLSKISLKEIQSKWKKKLDLVNGGQQEEEKFPRSTNYRFLLRYAVLEKDSVLLDYVHTTLRMIAEKGLYDHIEGGFTRYTTDKAWQIPHFEKMLYTNAQLISSYSLAYQTQKNENYKTVVYETLNFIKKQWLRNDHLLYASLNADSFNEKNELEEGAYYTWRKETLQQVLGSDFDLFSKYFNLHSSTNIVSEENLEEKYVLTKKHDDASFMNLYHLTEDQLKAKVNTWKTILLNERKKRNLPQTDTKVLTAWNALMLKAYTDAYKTFGDEQIKTQAVQTATAIKNKLISKEWKVLRSLNNPEIDGFLEDYAYLIDSFLSMYQITFDSQWLYDAKSLTTYVLKHFYSHTNNLFTFSEINSKGLHFEEFDVEDGIMPSANSVMSHNLLQLGHYFGNDDFLQKSKIMLQRNIPDIIEYPNLYANWLDLLLHLSQPYYEVVICGKDAHEKARALQQNYLPNMLLCGSTSDSELPLLKNRFNEGKTLIYVCVNRTCKQPTERIEKAIELMK